ncbi:hypothetical protein FRX31_018716, partial [Thalictrum thalictroides]
MLPGWNSRNNGDHDPRGRIWLLWDATQVTVDIISVSDQLIHTKVTEHSQNAHFVLSVIYGRNNKYDRRKLWQSLSSLAPNSVPWILCGDFNTCTDYEDKVGGSRLQYKDIEDVKDFLANNELDDLTAQGAFYTWSNKSISNARTLTKIDSDRVVNAKKDLDRIQSEIQRMPLDMQLAHLELEAINQYQDLARQEEASLHQKAKQKSVHLGDGNNGYFYRMVQGRRRHNTVNSIKTTTGNILKDDTDIKEEFLEFYHKLLAEEHSDSLPISLLDSMHFPSI